MQVSPIIDRFIPQRSYRNLEVASYNIGHSEVESISDVSITRNWAQAETKQIFFNTAKYANNIINYRKLLGSAMGLTHSKILKCTIPKKTSKYKAVCERNNTWPVHSRKKPLITSPDVVLDMPDIDTTLHNNVIDWGKQGQIATIFQGEVHLWVASSSHLACTQTDKSVLECIRWNRRGTHFAVARSRARLSIIDAKTCKVERTYTCECLDCEITAIEWSSSETVVSGCSHGSLMYVTKDYPRTFHFYRLLKHDIVDLKFSCRDNYLLASTSVTGQTVIFKWPIKFNCTSPTMVIPANNGITSIIGSTSWHPWKEPILALGELDNDVTIYDINTLQIMDYRNIKPYFRKSCLLDFLTFNPLTAELLVSFYCDRNTEEEFSSLTVFSNLDTRVDEMRFHVGRVPHALWDGTGTKLATIGADESLVIWNFFGKGTDTEKKMLARRKKKTKNNIFEMSKRFYTCIR